MTNYEMIKNMSMEEMALSIMCPVEMGYKEDYECDQSREMTANCRMCCYLWLKEEIE